MENYTDNKQPLLALINMNISTLSGGLIVILSELGVDWNTENVIGENVIIMKYELSTLFFRQNNVS